MTKDEAIARACEIRIDRLEGEEPTGATERWVEIMDDDSVPGPIRDVHCWVVEWSGDYGPTQDLYIANADGLVVKRAVYG